MLRPLQAMLRPKERRRPAPPQTPASQPVCLEARAQCSDIGTDNVDPVCVNGGWQCPAGYTRFEDCRGVPPGRGCRDASLRDGEAGAGRRRGSHRRLVGRLIIGMRRHRREQACSVPARRTLLVLGHRLGQPQSHLRGRWLAVSARLHTLRRLSWRATFAGALRWRPASRCGYQRLTGAPGLEASTERSLVPSVWKDLVGLVLTASSRFRILPGSARIASSVSVAV